MYYIVLYADGTIMILANKPERKAHQSTARFFSANPRTTIEEISGWYANGFQRQHRGIREIEL